MYTPDRRRLAPPTPSLYRVAEWSWINQLDLSEPYFKVRDYGFMAQQVCGEVGWQMWAFVPVRRQYLFPWEYVLSKWGTNKMIMTPKEESRTHAQEALEANVRGRKSSRPLF